MGTISRVCDMKSLEAGECKGEDCSEAEDIPARDNISGKKKTSF